MAAAGSKRKEPPPLLLVHPPPALREAEAQGQLAAHLLPHEPAHLAHLGAAPDVGRLGLVCAAEPTALALASPSSPTASKPGIGGGAWKKNKWNADEDAQLTKLVNSALENEKNKGEKKGSARGIKWELIGAEMNGRTGKQCREHWVNVLSPEVDSKAKWTPEEDVAIKEKVAEMGTCWSELVKQFPGRTSLAIKNRWNSMKRKEERQAAKGELPPAIPPPALQIMATATAEPALGAEPTAEVMAEPTAEAEEIPIATATVAAISVDPMAALPAKAVGGRGVECRPEREAAAQGDAPEAALLLTNRAEQAAEALAVPPPSLAVLPSNPRPSEAAEVEARG